MRKRIIVSIVLVGIFSLGGINFSFIGLGINTVYACVIGPNGDCVPVPVGSAGLNTEHNTRTRFWSNHTTRQHRPVGMINNMIRVTTVNWGNPQVRHWTAWYTHAGSAGVRAGLEIR